MKWIGLFGALCGAFVISVWLRRNRDGIPNVVMAMGFLPFVIGPLHLFLAVISWPDWPGYGKGMEFSVLDALALALYLVLRPLSGALPFRWPMAIYFGAVLLSVLQAEQPVAALFYAWQLLRMFFVSAVVAKASLVDSRAPLALLKGMGGGLGLAALSALWQHVSQGAVQSGGIVGHQNLLGLMSHLVVFPAFALMLAGRGGLAPAAITFTGLAAEVMTTSRGTIGIAGAMYAAVFVFSARRRWTSRKLLIFLLGSAALFAVLPIVLLSFQERFAGEANSDYDERAAFLSAAQMILSDHPFGVGANHYVVAANEGYNERAGVATVGTSLLANVHNAYMLVAVETGYMGLVAFIIFLLSPLVAAARYSWRYRSEERGDLLLGLAAALLAVYVHSLVEWIFVTFQAQYLFAFDVGLVAALAQPAVRSPVPKDGLVATPARSSLVRQYGK